MEMAGVRAIFVCLTGFLVAGSDVAAAASLRVTPVTLDMQVPRAAATLRLRNDADRPLDAQIRVFRWTQKGGADQYEATTDVVISPPAARLAPNVDYTVRVVRVSKAPVATEESYRVVVDELPTNLIRRSGTINFVMRHSIPVFFRNPQARQPKVSWRLAQSGGKLKLVAVNTGGIRLRLSDLSLLRGNSLSYRKRGLVGYVLAGATMEWPVVLRQRAPITSLALKAESQLGPVNEIVQLVGR